MERPKSDCAGQTVDVTHELSILVKLGWNERQIAGLARMRASYRKNQDCINVPPMFLNKDEQKHLTFVRWMYEANRLKS